MIRELQHDMGLRTAKDERSRQEFIAALRGHVLGPMADSMRRRFEEQHLPQLHRDTGKAPENGAQVHEQMQNDDYFRAYSAVRYNAQEMVFRSVIPAVDRQLDELNQRGRAIRNDRDIALDPSLDVPRNVANIDVHLAPGSYHSEYAADDVAAGAIYDNSINVFAFNQMGRNIDDIGWTMANYLRLKFPDFSPARILDCGCTVGHNTVPWKLTFPEADVHGIDVSAPVLRYAAARARGFDADVNFTQMNATAMQFDDNEFDVVFSSMFLHELPLKDIHLFLSEAFRVLKPGGLLLNMELPPNASLGPYDQFYLDWDSYYNNEPYYKTYRDQDNRDLCQRAGFARDRYREFVAPRYTYTNEATFRKEIETTPRFDEHTGTLTEDLRWYAFGSWK
ncbi:MAG: class I SAM-dependent methyltransferase [Gammaproteobacteria bacterium]|nr:class I SAM-dependent methyltransferase [Gammaproteobacteria bacterium]